MRGNAKSKSCPPHEPNGWQCTVAHFDKDRNLLPGCPQCRHCGRYYRPDEADKPIEINVCDICKENEANRWSNPEYNPKFPGWTCDGCRKNATV